MCLCRHWFSTYRPKPAGIRVTRFSLAAVVQLRGGGHRAAGESGLGARQAEGRRKLVRHRQRRSRRRWSLHVYRQRRRSRPVYRRYRQSTMYTPLHYFTTYYDHCLHHLLPPKTSAHCRYSLRERQHSFQLFNIEFLQFKNSFVNRCLLKFR